jgi:CRP/FNR family transcriptional regulator, cyclic AMP receptor protein
MRRLDRVHVALFDGLEGEALEEVYWRLRPRHFDAGQVICRAGEPGDSLLVIRHGLVHVLASEPAGDAAGGGEGPAVLARQRPGDVVGELALLTGEPRAATLVAQLPTDALELRRETFLSLAARYPVLLANLARILSRRARRAMRSWRPWRSRRSMRPPARPRWRMSRSRHASGREPGATSTSPIAISRPEQRQRRRRCRAWENSPAPRRQGRRGADRLQAAGARDGCCSVLLIASPAAR